MQRRGLGVALQSFPKSLETLTLSFQEIWSILRQVQVEGVQEYVNHECSTQCYVIALIGPKITTTKSKEGVQTLCNQMHLIDWKCLDLFK